MQHRPQETPRSRNIPHLIIAAPELHQRRHSPVVGSPRDPRPFSRHDAGPPEARASWRRGGRSTLHSRTVGFSAMTTSSPWSLSLCGQWEPRMEAFGPTSYRCDPVRHVRLLRGTLRRSPKALRHHCSNAHTGFTTLCKQYALKDKYIDLWESCCGTSDCVWASLRRSWPKLEA